MNQNLGRINEKKYNTVHKTVLSNLIVSYITFFISNSMKDKHNKEKIVNKQLLTKGVYSKIIYRLFMKKKFTKYFITDFISLMITYVTSKKGRKGVPTRWSVDQRVRKCKRKNFKSYSKKYKRNDKYE